MATRLSREGILDQLRISLSWACTTYLQDSIYKSAFKTETPNDAEVNEHVAANSRLVLFLDQMNERAEPLSSIILQAIAPENESLYRYAGFYLAATGDSKAKQAFVAGIVEKMIREQNAVTWTQAAKAEDAQCRAWAGYYFITAWVLLIVWLAFAGWIIYKNFFA